MNCLVNLHNHKFQVATNNKRCQSVEAISGHISRNQTTNSASEASLHLLPSDLVLDNLETTLKIDDIQNLCNLEDFIKNILIFNSIYTEIKSEVFDKEID